MILELIAGLSDVSNRLVAARKLAEFLGATNLVIFIRDPNVNLLLPGPGFLQTLQNGSLWRSFISDCGSTNYFRGQLPYPDKDTLISSTGIVSPDGSIAILIGGEPREEELENLRKLLPLITALLKQEQQMQAYHSLAVTAENTARKAEKLARNLDTIRQDLRKALTKQEIDRQNIEHLMKKKDEFMNIASHELKTPLTSMKSYVQMISRRLTNSFPDKLLLDFTDKANKQAEKLVHLVNDLFDLSKIQSGRLQFSFTVFDLNELIRECIEHVQHTVETHTITLKGSIPLQVEGDKNRLEQVINNLLSNAVKYSPNADRVLVEVLSQDNWVEIKVTDFGIGIPEAELPNISKRFFRVESVSNNFNGLGLGLYISSQIIKGHSGELIVESAVNQGSTFGVKIPIKQAQKEFGHSSD